MRAFQLGNRTLDLNVSHAEIGILRSPLYVRVAVIEGSNAAEAGVTSALRC